MRRRTSSAGRKGSAHQGRRSDEQQLSYRGRRRHRRWSAARRRLDCGEAASIPAAFFIGGPGDSAYTFSNATYAATPATAQVIKANLPEAGHYGAYPMPLPEWVTVVSSWLDWQLKGGRQGQGAVRRSRLRVVQESGLVVRIQERELK